VLKPFFVFCRDISKNRTLSAVFDYYAIPSEQCRAHLGCWSDKENDRAIKGGLESYNTDPIEKCHKLAVQKGYTVFAVQYNIQCFTAADAESTYKKYGDATNCKNGVGGSYAQDVYKIKSCKPGTMI
jgi:hypothetical protein